MNLVLSSQFLVPGSWFLVLCSWFSVLGFQFLVLGGEGGIRTHVGFQTQLVFETSTFNHSVTSPISQTT